MAKYLRLIGVKLDHIISSPAIRAMETAKILADRMKIDDIEYNPELYNGNRTPADDGVKLYFQTVRNIAEKHDVVMVVGHNDDISLLGHYLTGDGVPFMKK
jgi:phosphohistidine phosphatase SixA